MSNNSDSRTKRFVKNSAATIAQQVITILVGLITPRVLLLYYGSEVNGLITSLTQFFSYFNLVEAGLAGAAIFALYKPLADQNRKEINSILTATKIFYTRSGFVFVALTVLLATLYPIIVKSAEVSAIEMLILVFVLGTAGFIDFFTLSKYRALLTADQRLYVISLATSLHMIVNTVIIIVLASFEVNIVLLKAIALMSVFLRSIILILYCKKNYKYLDFSETPNFKALNKRWDAFYLQILGAIHTGAPVIIISMVVGSLKLTSVYAVFNLVIAGIGSIVGVFTSGLSASFGDVIARKEQGILIKAFGEFETLYYMCISTIYSVSFLLIQPFVNVYTSGITDTNYNLPWLGTLFVLSGMLYSIKTPQGMLVISAGHYKETKIQTTIQGAITVIGGIVFSLIFGIYGVLLASILSDLYRDIDLMFYVPREILKTDWKKTLYKILRLAMNTAIVVLIGKAFSSQLTQINNFGQWIMWGCILATMSVVVNILTNYLLDKETMKGIFVRIKGLFHR